MIQNLVHRGNVICLSICFSLIRSLLAKTMLESMTFNLIKVGRNVFFFCSLILNFGFSLVWNSNISYYLSLVLREHLVLSFLIYTFILLFTDQKNILCILNSFINFGTLSKIPGLCNK